jgi:hypothetical protein
MSLSIIDFRMRVIAELPDTTNVFVERLILDGIQDLCRETSCYIDATTTTSTNGTHTYTLTPSTSTVEVIGFWQGKYNNFTLPKISNKDMDLRDAQWETRSGSPDAIIYDGNESIRFNVTPDTTGKAIQMEAIIQPSSVDGVIPPKIERRHLEAVKSYVKWKVYEAPKTFNPELAVYYQRDYKKRLSRLNIEIIKDGTELEVTPRSFVTGKVRNPIGITVDTF